MFSLIQAAGWPIIFLLLLSIVCIALIFERFLSLRPQKIVPKGLVHEAMQATPGVLPDDTTIQKLASNSALGIVLASAIKAARPVSAMSEDNIKNAMESSGRLVVYRMERFLPALATIATIAPLLGLFGTVIGMIEIFGVEQIPGQSNPGIVAHGISVALYNTAFGLLLAVVAYLFHHYFRSRVESYTLLLEQESEQFFQHMVKLIKA